MTINRKYLGVITITGLLIAGTPALFAGSIDNRVERPSREEVIQSMYSGSEEVQPPTAPSSSFEEPVVGMDKERGNLNK